MARDYFARAEFHAFAGPLEAEDADIDVAQAEVIERIEAWALTAWPTVTGTDGDGTAAEARQYVQNIYRPSNVYVLERLPVISVVAIALAGEAVPVEGYVLNAAAGVLHYRGFKAPSPPDGLYAGPLTLTYRYGFTDTPRSVKRAAMMATKTILQSEGGKSKLPSRTRQYTSEGTTIVLAGEVPIPEPFPWDSAASEVLAGYWTPPRPQAEAV